MADLKRWFKVWSTVVHDPHFQEMPLEDVARWVLLGALMVSSGEGGRLVSPAGARGLSTLLRVPDAEAVKRCLARLPNVILSDAPVYWPHGHDKPPVCDGVAWGVRAGLEHSEWRGSDPFEEWCKRNGTFYVTWKNWRKYQEDSTAAQRGRTLRSKRRGEEIRGDTTPPNPPLAARPPSPEPDSFTRFWAAYPRHIGKPGTLKAWRALKPSNGTVETILAGLTRWRAWWAAEQTPQNRVPYPATWLRDRRWEDDLPSAAEARDPYADYPRS